MVKLLEISSLLQQLDQICSNVILSQSLHLVPHARLVTLAFHIVIVAVSPGGTRMMGVPLGGLPLCVGTAAFGCDLNATCPVRYTIANTSTLLFTVKQAHASTKQDVRSVMHQLQATSTNANTAFSMA